MNARNPSGEALGFSLRSGELSHHASVLCTQTLASLRALSGAGSSFANDLGNLYLDTAPQLLNNLRVAYREGNLKLARRLAHSLLSCSENMGALRLADRCAALEQYRGSPLCEEGAALLSAIEIDFAEAEQALRQEFGLSRAAQASNTPAAAASAIAGK